MTYTIKNTLNGKTVRDGISGQVRKFSTKEEAAEFAATVLKANRTQAAFSLKTTKFAYAVVGA